MTDNDFVTVTPQDLYPGWDPKRQPLLDDHWGPDTKMFTPSEQVAKEAWHADSDRWSVAHAMYLSHRHQSVPRRYRDAYEMAEGAHDWAQRMGAGEEPNTLILFGGVGTGKTHSAVAAACLISALTKNKPTLYTHGPNVWFYLVSTLLRELKNFSNSEEREEAIWRTKVTKTLILDDLTRPTTSDFDHESITEILDYRLGRFPTIVTSNVGERSELDEFYGEHLASRLIGGATLVPVVGPDRRRS